MTQRSRKRSTHLRNGATIFNAHSKLLFARMKLPSGLKIIEDQEGSGPAAETGHTIVYNCRFFLNHGDEVPINDIQAERGIPDDRIRREDGQKIPVLPCCRQVL